MLLKRMYRNYENYMVRAGRKRSRTILLSRDDRTLSDLGMSRYLIESGIDAWPWTAPSEESVKFDLEGVRATESQAMEELEALTDYELQDLGVSRGQIKESVLEGRPGFVIDRERKVA